MATHLVEKFVELWVVCLALGERVLRVLEVVHIILHKKLLPIATSLQINKIYHLINTGNILYLFN